MTLFELVRQEVTAEDAARLYGLKFDRARRGFCPWHDDGHHAALQFFGDGGCYCHSCHQGGDATAITAQMLGLTQKAAAERIRQDFHLDTPIDRRPDPATKAKAQRRKDERERFNRQWSFLCDVLHEADQELAKFDRDSAWDSARFVAILTARTRASEQLDYLWGTCDNGRSA